VVELLQQHGAIALALGGILGLVIGSFLNVVVYRLPIMMERDWREQCREVLGQADSDSPPDGGDDSPPLTLLAPASHCPHCGHSIAPHENIPIVSYLLLGGRCSACKAQISARYPIVEATTALPTSAVPSRAASNRE